MIHHVAAGKVLAQQQNMCSSYIESETGNVNVFLSYIAFQTDGIKLTTKHTSLLHRPLNPQQKHASLLHCLSNPHKTPVSPTLLRGTHNTNMPLSDVASNRCESHHATERLLRQPSQRMQTTPPVQKKVGGSRQHRTISIALAQPSLRMWELAATSRLHLDCSNTTVLWTGHHAHLTCLPTKTPADMPRRWLALPPTNLWRPAKGQALSRRSTFWRTVTMTVMRMMTPVKQQPVKDDEIFNTLMQELLVNTGQWLVNTNGQTLVKQLVDSRPKVLKDANIHMQRLLVNSWSTVGQQRVNSWSTVGQQLVRCGQTLHRRLHVGGKAIHYRSTRKPSRPTKAPACVQNHSLLQNHDSPHRAHSWQASRTKARLTRV